MNKFVNSQSQASEGANAPSQDVGKDFFNLHLSGIGYLSRVRWVNPTGRGRKSEPFLCCAINAMHGAVDDPNYSYLDLRVSGEEAITVIEQLHEAVEQDRKVFVSFKVGDIYAHCYERTVRDRDGRSTGQKEPAALIKGRLLLINMAKVDDELVYQREEVEDQPLQPAQAEDEGGHEAAGDAGDQIAAGHRSERAERPSPRANVPVRDRSASRSFANGARH